MKRMLLALLLTAVFAVPAFAQMKDMGGMKGSSHGHGQHLDKMGDMTGMCLKHADKLGLAEAQVDQLAAIHRGAV